MRERGRCNTFEVVTILCLFNRFVVNKYVCSTSSPLNDITVPSTAEMLKKCYSNFLFHIMPAEGQFLFLFLSKIEVSVI
jgi:hypothetical protein